MTQSRGPRALSFWSSTLLSFLSGLLYFAAFPGLDLWPFAFVALTPMMFALRSQPPLRGLWLGWVAGFTMTMVGFYWLMEMLRVFSGFSTPLCFVFMSLLCAYQAGRMALAGWLSTRATERNWPYGLAFSLAFAASEFAFPLLFPWYYGATVHQIPLLIQTADLGGPIAVGLVLVAANWAVFRAIAAGRSLSQQPWRLHFAVLSGLATALTYGAIRSTVVRRDMRHAAKARVGVVQANMSLFGKRHEMEEGLRRHLALTKQLRDQGNLDIVVWSETSVMRPVEESIAKRAVPQAYSGALGVPAIAGSVLVRPVTDERDYVFFNSALSTDKHGNVTGRYDKTFLLAFGEYLPMGETFPVLYRLSPNSGHFSAGTSLEPLPVAGHWVCTNICYEDLVPSFINRMFRHRDSELIVNMTNDAWFGDTLEPWQHLALAQFRAVEQRRYLIRSTNSGISAFVDPTGEVVVRTEPFAQAAISHQIAYMNGRTVYRMIGDLPWWLVSIASLALAFWGRSGKLLIGTTAASSNIPEA